MIHASEVGFQIMFALVYANFDTSAQTTKLSFHKINNIHSKLQPGILKFVLHPTAVPFQDANFYTLFSYILSPPLIIRV